MTVSPFRHLMHRVLTWSGPVLLLLVLLFQSAVWWSEFWWFEALGYGAHFSRLFGWRAGAFGAGALLFGLWMGINAHIAWRNAAARSVPLSFFQSDDATRLIPLEDKLHLDRYRRRATFIFLAALSWMAGLGFSARYALFVRAFSLRSTGISDPASNFDLAFFLFALPLYTFLSRFLMLSIVAALGMAVAIYLYEETIGPRTDAGISGPNRVRAPRVSRAAAKHLAALWAMLLIWRGLECILSVPRTFVSSGNVATRVFDSLDISYGWTSAGLFALSAPLIALLSALSIAREPRYRTFLLGLAWMVCAGAIPSILPLVVGRSPQNPDWNQAIERHIRGARRAWGLDAVEVRPLAPASDAPFRAVKIGAKTAAKTENKGAPPLPQWPAPVARNAFNRRLEARGSEFRVERVTLEREGDGLVYRGLALAPRPDATGDWRARHERAPRGLWLQMEASRAGDRGAPIFLPEKSVSELLGAPIAPPQGWREPLLRGGGAFGSEGAGDSDEWILSSSQSPGEVATEEVAMAAAEREDSGVVLAGWGVKTLLAARFLEPMLARGTGAGDRIFWHRGAAERCRELAPFLDWSALDARPVLVSSGLAQAESLKWLVPGLVWSDDHPDSATPAAPGTAPPGANYGKQGALGVVDARTGATTLFLLDENEPFCALYHRAFPGLFAPATAIPSEIRAALRPAASLLSAQTLVWARYHDPNPRGWVARRNDYRALFLASAFDDGAPRPLAAQPSGEWSVMAYAQPQGQAGSGAAAPLLAILGADESTFRLGAPTRFVEWRASGPLALPSLVVESLRSEAPGGAPASVPTLSGVAPRLDSQGQARGLLVTRGAATLQPAPTGGALQGWQLDSAIQISGRNLETAPPVAAPSLGTIQPSENARLQNAIAAWREVRAAREKGDWNAVARAEKQLDALLGAAPRSP